MVLERSQKNQLPSALRSETLWNIDPTKVEFTPRYRTHLPYCLLKYTPYFYRCFYENTSFCIHISLQFPLKFLWYFLIITQIKWKKVCLLSNGNIFDLMRDVKWHYLVCFINMYFLFDVTARCFSFHLTKF